MVVHNRPSGIDLHVEASAPELAESIRVRFLWRMVHDPRPTTFADSSTDRLDETSVNHVTETRPGVSMIRDPLLRTIQSFRQDQTAQFL
jgi:hypothetical protein